MYKVGQIFKSNKGDTLKVTQLIPNGMKYTFHYVDGSSTFDEYSYNGTIEQLKDHGWVLINSGGTQRKLPEWF